MIFEKLIETAFSTGPLWYKIFTVILIFLITGWIIAGIKLRSAEQKQISEDKIPKLYAKLVLEEIANNKVRFSYKITNNGNMTAENIKYGTISSSFIQMEENPKHNRELAENETISAYPASFLVPFLPDSVFLKVDLLIFYSATIDGESKNYKTTIKFLIPNIALKEGEYEPESIIRNEDSFSKKQFSQFNDYINILESEEATLFLVFSEFDQHPKLVNSLLSTPTKILFFNPVNRTVTFEIKWKSGDVITMTNEIKKQESGNHLVELVWTNNKIEFMVDGNTQVKIIPD